MPSKEANSSRPMMFVWGSWVARRLVDRSLGVPAAVAVTERPHELECNSERKRVGWVVDDGRGQFGPPAAGTCEAAGAADDLLDEVGSRAGGPPHGQGVPIGCILNARVF